MDHGEEWKRFFPGQVQEAVMVKVALSQSHILTQMGNFDDSLFSMDFSYQRTTENRVIR